MIFLTIIIDNKDVWHKMMHWTVLPNELYEDTLTFPLIQF